MKSKLSILDSYVNLFLIENGRATISKVPKLVKNTFLLFVGTESLSHLSHCWQLNRKNRISYGNCNFRQIFIASQTYFVVIL